MTVCYCRTACLNEKKNDYEIFIYAGYQSMQVTILYKRFYTVD